MKTKNPKIVTHYFEDVGCPYNENGQCTEDWGMCETNCDNDDCSMDNEIHVFVKGINKNDERRW